MKNKGLIIYNNFIVVWYDYPPFNPKQRWYAGRKYKTQDGSTCIVEKVDVVTGGQKLAF